MGEGELNIGGKTMVGWFDQERGFRPTIHTHVGHAHFGVYLRSPKLEPAELRWGSCAEIGRGPSLHKLKACEILPAGGEETRCLRTICSGPDWTGSPHARPRSVRLEPPHLAGVGGGTSALWHFGSSSRKPEAVFR